MILISVIQEHEHVYNTNRIQSVKCNILHPNNKSFIYSAIHTLHRIGFIQRRGVLGWNKSCQVGRGVGGVANQVFTDIMYNGGKA